MSEPEQCIICLDFLPRPSPATLDSLGSLDKAGLDLAPATTPDITTSISPETAANGTAVTPADAVDEDSSYLNVVAALDGCEHVIHDACIRSWAQKTNTCPICRKPFHFVRVYNGVDGTAISTYHVQDKKQVAEFDVQQWLGDNPEEEEEEGNPCPICNSAEREDILLLCDSCDAAYHTHCVGIDYIPDGDWYCMECAHLFDLTQEPEPLEWTERAARPRQVRRPQPRDARGQHVRTRARLRRARRNARNVEWQGAWGQFSGRFYEMSELDLDNHDDEDDDLEQFRRFQQLDRRELQRWQQRVDIAHRLGASDAFTNNIPPQISQQLQPTPPLPPPVEETQDERRAWGAFERAREAENSNTTSRKRKARSVTTSPAEPVQEPERKLKRPRTRRLPTTAGEASASASSPAAASTWTARPTNGQSTSNGVPPREGHIEPALVSSLLKELEPGARSEDEAAATGAGWRGPLEALSPALSPSPSAHSSPRALSLTPPPLATANTRPGSPTTLSLSTHIEPIYPPANYSPNRHNSDNSDSDSRPSRPIRSLELRQPRPRRPHQVPTQTEELSPTRWVMTQEEKKNINDIVKTALRPHWRAQKLTTEQYATINRDISRKLYDEVKGPSALADEARRGWEQRATQEVAQAIAGL